MLNIGITNKIVPKKIGMHDHLHFQAKSPSSAQIRNMQIAHNLGWNH